MVQDTIVFGYVNGFFIYFANLLLNSRPQGLAKGKPPLRLNYREWDSKYLSRVYTAPPMIPRSFPKSENTISTFRSR
jgi:hypothetical protein